MNDTFNLINKHRESLDEFYSEACYIHGVRYLRTTINNSAHNPIGNIVQVTTEKGDIWSVSDEDEEPNVKFKDPSIIKKKTVTMRTEIKSYTDYNFEVEATLDGALIFNELKFKNEDELFKYLREIPDGGLLNDSFPFHAWNTLSYSETEEKETILSFNVSNLNKEERS